MISKFSIFLLFRVIFRALPPADFEIYSNESSDVNKDQIPYKLVFKPTIALK